LWAAGWGGLTRNDLKGGKDSIIHYYGTSTHSISPPEERIRTVVEDIAGNVWIGGNNGLYKYSPHKQGMQVFRKDNTLAKDKRLPNNTVNTFCELNDSIVLIGTDAGFASFNKITKRFLQLMSCLGTATRIW